MALPSAAAAALAGGRGALERLQVPERERARLEQVGHQQARRPPEQVQEIADEPAPEIALAERRLEELRIADLLHLAHRALALEPVDQRLHRRVGDLLLLGEAVQDLAHGAEAQLPELLQDPCFGPGAVRTVGIPTKHCGEATTSSVGQ